MPEIILKHVTKRFGKFVAVDDLNLTIESNAFITLLGPSGCGKTTTLRMIAGLETPTEGMISIDGKVVFDADKGINLPPEQARCGLPVPELRAVAAHDGVSEHRLRPGKPQVG